MYRLRVLYVDRIVDQDLITIIHNFDQQNIKVVMEKCCISFSEEIHRFQTEEDQVYILVFTDEGKLAGYLLYSMQWGMGKRNYATAMQIDRQHGQSLAITQILLQAKNDFMRHLQKARLMSI